MEVGLGPGDFVLDGDPAPLPPPKKKRGHSPQFRPTSIVVNGWNFRPMSIVAKRSPIFATAELLFCKRIMLSMASCGDYWSYSNRLGRCKIVRATLLMFRLPGLLCPFNKRGLGRGLPPYQMAS